MAKTPKRYPPWESVHAHYYGGPVNEHAFLLAEDAYRRGFQHGQGAALQAVGRGVSARRMARWCMAVYRWRFLRSHKKPIPPPVIKEK